MVYIPSDNVLFPGCMIKETRSETLGNTADGDKVEYPKTINKVIISLLKRQVSSLQSRFFELGTQA